MKNKEFIETVLAKLNAVGVNAEFEEEFDEDEVPCAQIGMHLDSDEDAEDISDTDIRIMEAVRVLAELGARMDDGMFHGMPGGYTACSGVWGELHIEVSWADPEMGVGISFTLDA